MSGGITTADFSTIDMSCGCGDPRCEPCPISGGHWINPEPRPTATPNDAPPPRSIWDLPIARWAYEGDAADLGR